MLAEKKSAVEAAFSAYRACRAREEAEYGRDYLEVTKMEDEGPAPDPCAKVFEELLGALRAYEAAGGSREDFDFGEHKEAIYRAL
jgi:hypothetical protein